MPCSWADQHGCTMPTMHGPPGGVLVLRIRWVVPSLRCFWKEMLSRRVGPLAVSNKVLNARLSCLPTCDVVCFYPCSHIPHPRHPADLPDAGRAPVMHGPMGVARLYMWQAGTRPVQSPLCALIRARKTRTKGQAGWLAHRRVVSVGSIPP